MRVQIPVYTDRWMMGDRYGEVVKTSKQVRRVSHDQHREWREIAHIKLDKSGKTVRVWLDDCTEV